MLDFNMYHENIEAASTVSEDPDKFVWAKHAVDLAFWEALGFKNVALCSSIDQPIDSPPQPKMFGQVPDGVIVMRGVVGVASKEVSDLAMQLPGPPFTYEVDGHRHYAYRVGTDVAVPAEPDGPLGVTLKTFGAWVDLPYGSDLDRLRDGEDRKPAEHFPELDGSHVLLVVGNAGPTRLDVALTRYSLRGQGEALAAQAVLSSPLLGNVVLAGQATVWYAPPNAGKTLIGLKILLDAVADKRLNPQNVYYINADDNSEGLATKTQLLDDVGAHTLAPGFKEFKPSQLGALLTQMARGGDARGTVVILDTLKKFVSLMDKAGATAFATTVRHYVMAGGTMFAFAHTAKNPNAATGALRYAGTTDILEDFDAAYIMTVAEKQPLKGEQIVVLRNIKRRGNSPLVAAYAYANDDAMSYAERLASVHEVEPDLDVDYGPEGVNRSESEVISAIQTCIGLGQMAKMGIVKVVSKRINVSERTVIRALEVNTGEDPQVHRWRFVRAAHGKRIYSLLDRPIETGEPKAA
jgi:hypothetical protein